MKDDADRRELRKVALGHPVMPVACPCWLNGMAARMVLEPKPGTYALILSCSNDFTFSHPTAYPHEIVDAIQGPFKEIFNPKVFYRATGVVMLKLSENVVKQMDLFGETLSVLQSKKLYEAVDQVNEKYGKHKVYLGSSYAANHFAQHLGERGDIPERKEKLFRGETRRKRLALPMFMGEVK